MSVFIIPHLFYCSLWKSHINSEIKSRRVVLSKPFIYSICNNNQVLCVGKCAALQNIFAKKETTSFTRGITTWVTYGKWNKKVYFVKSRDSLWYIDEHTSGNATKSLWWSWGNATTSKKKFFLFRIDAIEHSDFYRAISRHIFSASKEMSRQKTCIASW